MDDVMVVVTAKELTVKATVKKLRTGKTKMLLIC